MRSPSEQVSEGQPGATELLIEPDAEVVQSHPRRQTCSQSLKLMGTLPPQAEGVEQLVVGALHDLADGGHPPPEALGPGLFRVPFGRMDDSSPVVMEPLEVVFGAFEALIGHVGSRGSRTHADEPFVGIGSQSEEGLCQRLVGGGGGPEAEAADDSGRGNGGEQTKAFVPADAVGPTDVGISSKPATPTTLGIPDGHRRAIESFVRTLPDLQETHQVQEESLDELGTGAHQAVELRATGQSREGIEQVGFGVAVEVPLAGEAGPPGEDGQGYDLAFGEGGLGAGSLFGRMGVAEVVNHNVKCGEEGVHIEHEESVPFPSGSGGKPTLACGHLPLKSPTGNSHQAFKAAGTSMEAVVKTTIFYTNVDEFATINE